jgi:transglutaminase-like putative cysteine protease
VALLYITLLRSVGIPARWESGWAIEPNSAGYHDWTEVYFEGIGWVPADPSYGRDTRDEPLADYYKSGLDFCRLATNQGICGQLNPKKNYVRSETVDFQAGEAEWSGGNLEYKDFDSKMTINSFEPLKSANSFQRLKSRVLSLS